MTAQIEIEETGNLEKLLARLPLAIREKYLKAGMRKAGRVVIDAARPLIRKPGYKGDKPNLKPLRQTLVVVIRSYTKKTKAIIGPAYPAGAHGHLVEAGHDIVRGGRKSREGRPVHKPGTITGRVKPHPFLKPAAEATATRQLRALEETILAGVESEVGNAGH